MSSDPTSTYASLTSSLELADTFVGERSAASATLSATGELGSGSIVRYEATVSGEGFSLVGASTVTLSAGGSTSLGVLFTPTVAGTAAGTLTLSRGSETHTCTLSALGLVADELYWSGQVTSLALGTVTVGDSQMGIALAVAPPDDAPPEEQDSTPYELTIAVSDATFSPSVTSCTLSPDTTLSIVVTFTPTAEQTYSATLTVAWTRGDTSGTLELALSGTGVLEDEDTDDASDDSTDSVQRAVLYVPSYETLVALGAPYVVDGETLSQSGFTLSTTRHVFLTADKAVTFQSNGNCWFQSNDGSTYARAGAKGYFVADKTTYVGGGEWVGIVAGVGSDATDPSFDSQGNPEKPSGVSGVESGFLAADISAEAFDQAITAINTYKNLYDTYYLTDPSKKTLGMPLNWIKKFLGTPVFLAWTLGKLGYFVLERVLGEPYRGLNMYSAAGLTMGTPSYTSILGTYGVQYAGANVTLMGAVNATLEGVAAATLDSIGDTAVISGVELSALAAWESSFSSRQGTLAYYGKSIAIGGLLTVGKQAPTVTLTMDAVKKIALNAVGPTGGTIALNAPLTGRVQAEVLMAVKLEAAKTKVVVGGAMYTIECTPTTMTISGPAGELVKLTPGEIALGPAAGPLKMTPAMVDVGAGSLQITPTGVTSKAPTLELL